MVIRALSLVLIMMLLAPKVCASQSASATTTMSAQPPSQQAAPAANPPSPQAASGVKGGDQKLAEISPLEPQGYTYSPEGRRDPFVSLLRRGSEVARNTTGMRVAGLSGLATSEVTLSGIVASKGGFVAMLQGVDRKTYIVRAGDKLFDGSVRAITADTMVILQQVNDPLSLEKQREVRKVLRQTEEAK